MRTSTYLINSLLTLLLISVCGCTDDGLGFSADDLKDGATTISLEAAFSPFSNGNLTRSTMAPPGRGMNILNDIVVLVYDKEGNLIPEYMQNVDFQQSDVVDEERFDSDASNQHKAEDDTKCLKNFSIRLPFGEYYIIAVANFGKYKQTGTSVVIEQTSYDRLTTEFKEDINTLDGLRKINVKWDSSNYLNNCEMLGYFAEKNANVPRARSEFPTVKVNRGGMQLRAWLRRCASKITIDFDGSGLRDNIYIYIKDAKIYDIPSVCTLGFGIKMNADGEATDYNNTITNENNLLNRPSSGEESKYNGHHIDYGEGDDYNNWPCIQKGRPVILENNDDPNSKIDFHKPDDYALFFYENMQGDAPNSKIPHADLENGGVAGDNNNYKDGVKFGTYIEVTAHYHSEADGNISDGDIRYRFMIGKDVEKSCDAERNYHYKLTLKFRGNANDYDWHIDYDEEKGFDMANPCYISYLYDHTTNFPFKYTPPKGYEVIGMKAEIVTNPWYPSNIAENKLSDTSIDIVPTVPSGDGALPYNDSMNKDNSNGFLSFRETVTNGIITDKDAANRNWGDSFSTNNPNAPDETASGYSNLQNAYINKNYYEGKDPSNNEIDLSKRVFMKDGNVEDDAQKDSERFSYSKNGEKYTFNIPLFTRAKVMVKQTGYTGNNPFVGYQRIARIRLTATIRPIGSTDPAKYIDETDEVNVVQVRRVVNPKGVYRSSGNSSPFHVTLMHLTSDGPDGYFKAIESHGSWIAEIIGDQNFITLDGKQRVSGQTGSKIDFNIKFNRMNSGNKNAVVRVSYHNHSCIHLIFVRQGYAAQQISPVGKQTVNVDYGTMTATLGTTTATKWSTFNMIAEDVEASDPRDEGSMFKFGNYSDPIDACNNAYTIGGKEVYYELTKDDFIPQGPFKMVGENGKISGEKTWGDIKENSSGFSTSSKRIKDAATINDFEQLYLTDNVRFGYGVLYADGATETQTSIDMAYGWKRGDNNAKGMRGVFAYYWDGQYSGGSDFNGRNIFFPIGRSGYGHRKNGFEDMDGKQNDRNEKGILRYSSNRCMPAYEYEKVVYKNFVQISPLFVFLYRRPGAIYWSRNIVEDKTYHPWNGDNKATEGDAYGIDFNYFTFDVNAITGTNIGYGKDACFVRCVGD